MVTERLNLKLARILRFAPKVAQPFMPVLPTCTLGTRRLNLAQYEFIVRMAPRVVNTPDLIRLTRIIETDASSGISVDGEELKVELAKLAMPTACQVFDLLRMLFPDEPVELPNERNGFTAIPPVL
jgi:hypothetical protein